MLTKQLWSAVLGVAVMVATGCDKGAPDAPSRVLTTVSVAGRSTYTAGDQAQLTVTARYSDGTSDDATAQASYESSNNAIVTVNGSGLVTAVSEGSATVTARIQGMAGSLPVTVGRADPIFSLGVTLGRLAVLEDCDAGATAGEFSYQVAVRFPDDASFTTVQETLNYPGNFNSAIARSDGESILLGNSASRSRLAREGDAVSLRLRVTEFDGGGLADPLMNDRTTTRTHRFTSGQWSQVGSNQVPLGSTGCRVELSYTFRATTNLESLEGALP